MDSSPAHTTTRTQVSVTCSKCGQQATVPFQPTPGRPVYCRTCFEKRPAPSPRGPRGRGGPNSHSKPNVQPQRRMISYRRKGHFVYDALASLSENDKLDDEQRRTFVEMLFTRGARQSTHAAQEYLDEKMGEGLLAAPEADALARVVDRYSERR